MEKEAGILMREMKISLTFQKQAYAVFFVVILSLVRGITYSDEIGIALEAPMATLAFTFCADTYTQEIASKRSEIWRLCPMKKRMNSIYRRIVIQEMFFTGEIESNEEIFLINVRQKAAFQSALNSLSLVKSSIENQMPEDFYSIDLMSAYEELGTITGETVGDDLVNEIFSKFCMGK